jgi:hypothetical protein
VLRKSFALIVLIAYLVASLFVVDSCCIAGSQEAAILYLLYTLIPLNRMTSWMRCQNICRMTVGCSYCKDWDRIVVVVAVDSIEAVAVDCIEVVAVDCIEMSVVDSN